MTSPQERLIAHVFHASRSEAKKKPNPGVEKIVEAMRGRAATACTELPEAEDTR